MSVGCVDSGSSMDHKPQSLLICLNIGQTVPALELQTVNYGFKLLVETVKQHDLEMHGSLNLKV